MAREKLVFLTPACTQSKQHTRLKTTRCRKEIPWYPLWVKFVGKACEHIRIRCLLARHSQNDILIGQISRGLRIEMGS